MDFNSSWIDLRFPYFESGIIMKSTALIHEVVARRVNSTKSTGRKDTTKSRLLFQYDKSDSKSACLLHFFDKFWYKDR